MTKRRRVTYSLDAFRDAVSAYRNKTMSSVDASKKFGVPESTIRKHKNNIINRVGSGRPCALTMNHEQYLVVLLKELQSIGVRLTKETLSKITGDFMRMAKKGNKDINNPGRHWFENFFKRNSDKLKMKKEIKLERSRRDNFTEEVRSNWFSKLKGILDLNNLHARPAQIWNCDESGFSDETQCEYVCVPSDTKFVFEQQGGTGRAFTTMLLCTSACGDVLSPLVVYAAKAVNSLWCAGGVPGTTYKCSESGWITEKIFTDWFKNCFLEQTKHIERPLLLVMDNHSAHISIDVIELAIKNQVILLCLPPHSTHALQPLDVVTLSSDETLSNSFSSTTIVQHSIDAPVNNNILQNRNSINSIVKTDAEQGSISNIEIIQNSTITTAQPEINFVSTFTSHATETMAFHSLGKLLAPCFGHSSSFRSLDNPFSMVSYPSTTTELDNEEENHAWADTDGVWSTRITAQIAIPVNDITEFSERSSGIKAIGATSTDSLNKFTKCSNGSKSLETFPFSIFVLDHKASFVLDSNHEIYPVYDEEEKTFHELTSAPIQVPPFSPTAAVRSIVTSCLQEMQPIPPVNSKRVRLERRYGEEITTGGLLQELKDKKAAKDAQVKRPRQKRKKNEVRS
ncbi:unnamed protein product [Rotaria sp. Silwood2]|nr:unnamed protein product [Rotaria sp. Silwood2]